MKSRSSVLRRGPPLALLMATVSFATCAAAKEDASTSSAAPVYRLAVWPHNATSPDFSLIDFDGKNRSLASYHGKVVVVFFGFVECPDVCPAELFKLSLAMKQLGPVTEHVQVLFITLDPQRDTKAKLKSYVSAFDSRFIGLTGSAAQIGKAADNFSVEYAKVETKSGYSIDHSTSTFVIDTSGHLRLVGAMTTSANDLAHDIQSLATE